MYLNTHHKIVFSSIPIFRSQGLQKMYRIFLGHYRPLIIQHRGLILTSDFSQILAQIHLPYISYNTSGNIRRELKRGINPTVPMTCTTKPMTCTTVQMTCTTAPMTCTSVQVTCTYCTDDVHYRLYDMYYRAP